MEILSFLLATPTRIVLPLGLVNLYAFAEKACSLGFLPNSTLEDLFLLSSVQEAINTIKNFEPKDNSEWFKRLKE